MRQSSGGLVSAIKSYFESGTTKENITERIWIGVADFLESEWDIIENEKLDLTQFPLLSAGRFCCAR